MSFVRSLSAWLRSSDSRCMRSPVRDITGIKREQGSDVYSYNISFDNFQISQSTNGV